MKEDFIKKYEYYKDVQLKKYNTYRLNSSCTYLIYPQTVQELILLLKELNSNQISYLLLGNGSNVILTRPHYDVVIKLDRLNKIKFCQNTVTAEAGVSLISLANTCMKQGLSGLEFAGGIPGLVGASVAMNAGAYNQDLGNVIREVKVLTPDYEVITMKKEELDFNYRHSFFKQHKDYICLEATIELIPHPVAEIKAIMDDRRNRRIESQPLTMPGAGSVFRNPPNNSAGKLIDDLGLKGYTIGGASISEKHANFIVNNGAATADDIIELINYIQDKVSKAYHINLILEQEIIR